MEDVARRAAVEGFLALAPDGLAPIGGYPGNDDNAQAMQKSLDGDKFCSPPSHQQAMVRIARYTKYISSSGF